MVFIWFLYRLKINELQRLSKIIEKKVYQGIVSLKKGCKFATSNQLKIYDNDLHDINNQPRFQN